MTSIAVMSSLIGVLCLLASVYPPAAAEGDAGNVTVIKDDGENVTVSEGNEGNVTVSKGDEGNVTVSKGDEGNVTVSKGDEGNVTVSKGDEGNVTVSKGDEGNVTVNKGDEGNVTVSKGDEGNVTGPILSIVGGTELDPYSWPFLVQIGPDGDNEFQSVWCGGAIIHESVILTAAHCFRGYRKKFFRVTAAEHNIVVTEGVEQRRAIAEVHIHKKYKRTTLKNDVALLKLTEPLDLEALGAEVIPLNEDDNCPVDGQECQVAGWGTLESGGDTPDAPQEVGVDIVGNTECADAYEGFGKIYKSSVCAGMPEGGKDSCQGDSGGPFICECDGEWKHVGIVSWGLGCAWEGYPGVYTRTSSLAKWINKKLRKLTKTP